MPSDDLTLPVSRCPGIAEVAREVLGLDPWAYARDEDPLTWRAGVLSTLRGGYWRAWWAGDIDARPCVPLAVPAGRLVAETWLTRMCGMPAEYLADDQPHDDATERLHAACLYLGDLLRLCSALGVEVPAGTVPRLERAATAEAVWLVAGPGWPRGALTFVAANAVGGEILVPALAGITDPRAALDAIIAENLTGESHG